MPVTVDSATSASISVCAAPVSAVEMIYTVASASADKPPAKVAFATAVIVVAASFLTVPL